MKVGCWIKIRHSVPKTLRCVDYSILMINDVFFSGPLILVHNVSYVLGCFGDKFEA